MNKRTTRGGGEPPNNVTSIKGVATRRPQSEVIIRGMVAELAKSAIGSRDDYPAADSLFTARMTGEGFPAEGIMDGDYLLVSVCEDVPDSALAVVKDASDGRIYLGYFYRESDGTVRLEKRQVEESVTIPRPRVASIARVLRVERDIVAEGGAR